MRNRGSMSKRFRGDQLLLPLLVAAVGIGSASLVRAQGTSADWPSDWPDLVGPYTSDPFSVIQDHGPPQLTPPAREYFDNFTADMDPAIQCYQSGLNRHLYSPAGTTVAYQDGNITLSGQVVYLDGRSFPSEYDLSRRENWPLSLFGYSIGRMESEALFVETRGLISRDILMGHVPILPSEQVIVKRKYYLIPIDQRWEARGIAPQEVNPDALADGRTIAMEVTLDDPLVFTEEWTATKHYREIQSNRNDFGGGGMGGGMGGGVRWEQSEFSQGSGVPQEFLDNYDGGCVLFPEYAEGDNVPVVVY